MCNIFMFFSFDVVTGMFNNYLISNNMNLHIKISQSEKFDSKTGGCTSDAETSVEDLKMGV